MDMPFHSAIAARDASVTPAIRTAVRPKAQAVRRRIFIVESFNVEVIVFSSVCSRRLRLRNYIGADRPRRDERRVSTQVIDVDVPRGVVVVWPGMPDPTDG